MEKPRVNSLVTDKLEHTTSTSRDAYLFLGEIPNMSGHCAVINLKTSKVDIYFHTSDLRELKDSEV